MGLVYVGPRHYHVDDQVPEPVFWEPDRIFEGKTVVIVGGGPSHADIDLDLLRTVPFIAVNSACRKVRPIATPFDILYFSDNSWSESFPELIADWPGRAITSNRRTKARLGDAVLRISVSSLSEKLMAFPDYVYASSGHGAACLAAVMGAKKLVLIGFEGKVVDGRSHGHDDYVQKDIPAYAERFIPGWVGLAVAFARNGVRVVNSTPDSAILSFAFEPFAEAISR